MLDAIQLQLAVVARLLRIVGADDLDEFAVGGLRLSATTTL